MFKEMTYVYAVYQEGSFTKAARKLYISQPGLSAQVKKAEQKIGLPIFDRSTNPVSLTEAGVQYIGYVEKIMQLQHDAERSFRKLVQRNGGSLRLGGSFFFLSYVFPPVAKQFAARYGKVDLSLVESRNRDLLSKLAGGEIDFFLEVDDLFSDQIQGLVWDEEHLILAVPVSLPVNSRLQEYQFTAEDIHERRHLTDDIPAVDLSAFADEQFILLREGNDSHSRAMEMCRRAGFTPGNIFMTADQMLTSYYLAMEGHGVAFVRDSILFHADLTEDLVFYRLDDPLATRKVYLYHRPEKDLGNAAAAFLQFVRNSPDIIKM